MKSRDGLLLVFALVLLLGGCKKDGDAGSDNSASGERGPVEIAFWYSYGGNNRKVTEELIAEFNESHKDIKVVGTYQGDYFEALAKLRVASRTKAGPVVTHVVGEAIPTLWDDGLLENLDGFASGERGEKLDRDDFIPALTQDGYFDYLGQEVPLVAIPFNRSTPIVFYNKKMFADAGLEPPRTWTELEQTAEKLTRRDGDDTSVWGFELPLGWWFWYGMLHQAGGKLFADDGKSAAFDEGPGEKALELLVRMVKAGTMKHPPGRDYNAWEVANTDFLNQRVAMIWTSTAFLSYFTENARFDVGTAFLPADKRRAVPTGGTFFVVLKNKPEPEKKAAWTFVRWMSEPAQTAKWSRKTGYMPVRKSALESEEMKAFYRDNPNFKTTIDQLEHAVKFPFHPKLLEIQRNVLQPNLEKPVVTDVSAADVMKTAGGQANKLLAP